MRTVRSAAAAAVTAALALSVTATVAHAQARERFQWPEPAENLQVLPKDFGGQQLRQVMLGFSRALGVNCYHCHVGGPGMHLREFDFVSDEKATKKTAREMLKMVRSINQDVLTKIESTGTRLEVSCTTCHRGVPRPEALEGVLAGVIATDGVEAAVARYRELRERHYGGGAYDFGEATLNGLGYRLLGEDKVDDAIAVFRLNVEMFPDAGNPYDSLAEAYLKKGDAVRAETFYRKSLEVDPGNDNAVEQLVKLHGAAPASPEEAPAPAGGGS